jgi:enoyl-CoA hydratase/carnithine racemase
MAYENIIFEKEENIAIITFNRPDAMNALNNQTRSEFREAIAAVAADDQIKVLILTGSGKAFVAGSDIKEFSQTSAYDAHNIQRLGGLVEKLDKPVIAAVNGFCLVGGNEIAMGCDIIIASEEPNSARPKSTSASFPAEAVLSGCLGSSVCAGPEADLHGEYHRRGGRLSPRSGQSGGAVDQLMPAARSGQRSPAKVRRR